MWFRNGLTELTHSLGVRNQGILKIPARFFFCVASRRTSLNVRRIGRIARCCWFDDYWIAPDAHLVSKYSSIASRTLATASSSLA